MRHAVCNELFGKLDFEESCLMTARYGFQGVEIAPFTLFDGSKNVDIKKIHKIKQILDQAGLKFVGFHWLFLSPKGLHITSPDLAIRKKSWDHLKRLVDITGEWGGGVLVLGSPKQRNAIGISLKEALEYLKEDLSKIAPYAAERNSTILIEALPKKHTNIINTLEESKQLIRSINKVGINGMFDFHNCADENIPWSELIENNFDIIQHIHLNGANGSYPSTKNINFIPAFQKLADKKYNGWISLEIFHKSDNPELILSKTRNFLIEMERKTKLVKEVK